MLKPLWARRCERQDLGDRARAEAGLPKTGGKTGKALGKVVLQVGPGEAAIGIQGDVLVKAPGRGVAGVADGALVAYASPSGAKEIAVATGRERSHTMDEGWRDEAATRL